MTFLAAVDIVGEAGDVAVEDGDVKIH